MLYIFIALRTLAVSCSNWNSGVCTPITTNPSLLYLSYQEVTCGSVRIQLMQVYVQKSTKTTFPLRLAIVSGLFVFNHLSIPTKSGAGWLALNNPVVSILCVAVFSFN